MDLNTRYELLTSNNNILLNSTTVCAQLISTYKVHHLCAISFDAMHVQRLISICKCTPSEVLALVVSAVRSCSLIVTLYAGRPCVRGVLLATKVNKVVLISDASN